jgi:hypothetical protein
MFGVAEPFGGDMLTSRKVSLAIPHWTFPGTGGRAGVGGWAKYKRYELLRALMNRNISMHF